MASWRGQDPGIPWASILAILGVSIGGLYLIPEPLKTSRPAAKELEPVPALGDEQVESRLWQDPFDAIDRDANSEKTQASLWKWLTTLTDSHEEPQLASLRNRIQRHSKNKSGKRPLLILPVMVPGTAYPESVEARIRYRYAVLAALAIHGFVATEEGRIGYMSVRWPRSGAIKPRAMHFQISMSDRDPMMQIPFEWFRPRPIWQQGDPDYHVLVLWLSDEMFADHPLIRLASFLERLGVVRVPVESLASESSIAQDITVRVLGPAASTTLSSMWEDTRTYEFTSRKGQAVLRGIRKKFRPSRPPEKSRPKRKVESSTGATPPGSRVDRLPDNLWIYSPWSTATEDLLSKSHFKRDRLFDYRFTRQGEWMEHHFISTIGSDDELAAVLVQELIARRVIGQAADGEEDRKVVLLSEWDTFYGQAWPETFAAVYLQRCLKNTTEDQSVEDRERYPEPSSFKKTLDRILSDPSQWPRNILCYTYLRGVDGEIIARRSEPERSKSSAKDGTNQESGEQSGLRRPEGNGQFDYIRRAVDHLDATSRTENGQTTIGAVGIVGSDVYDKLTLLQAFRDRFPGAVFFTTDLDARMFHPSELRWTRNLIIASHYGLSIPPELCLSGKDEGDDADDSPAQDKGFRQQIPPFRDSYQTSVHLTTLLALRDESAATEEDRHITHREHGGMMRQLHPRLFEIGIDGAHEISFNPAGLSGRGRERLRQMGRSRLWLGGCVFVMAAAGLFVFPHAAAKIIIWAFPFIPFVVCVIIVVGSHLEVANQSEMRHTNPVEVRGSSTMQQVDRASQMDEVGQARGRILPWHYTSRLAWLSVCFGLTWVLLVGVSRTCQRVVLGASKDAEEERLACGWLCLLILTLGYGFFAIVPCYYDEARGEPFGLLSGISAWPTEAVRLLAFLVAVFFLLKSNADLKRDAQALEQKYLLKSSSEAPPGDGSGTGIVKRLKDLWARIPRSVGDALDRLKEARKTRKDISIAFWEVPGGNSVDVQTLFCAYRMRGKPLHRRLRFLPAAVVFVIFGFSLMFLFGFPSVPIRDDVTYYIDRGVVTISVGAMAYLVFGVVDATRLCQRFVSHLSDKVSRWPSPLIDDWAMRKSVTVEDAAEWLDIRFIGQRTKIVGRLIIYPFVVLVLIILARNRYFDYWDWPLSLYLIFGTGSAYCLYCAVVLRRAAEDARQNALERLRARTVSGRAAEDAKQSTLERLLTRAMNAERAAELELLEQHHEALIDEIEKYKEGAFAPVSRHPLIAATLLPFGGAGAVTLLDYLSSV